MLLHPALVISILMYIPLYLQRTAILSVVAYLSRSSRCDMEGSPMALTKFVKRKGASKLRRKRSQVTEGVQSTMLKGEISYSFGQCPRMLSRLKDQNLVSRSLPEYFVYAEFIGDSYKVI
jgi:hypothetical protein